MAERSVKLRIFFEHNFIRIELLEGEVASSLYRIPERVFDVGEGLTPFLRLSFDDGTVFETGGFLDGEDEIWDRVRKQGSAFQDSTYSKEEHAYILTFNLPAQGMHFAWEAVHPCSAFYL